MQNSLRVSLNSAFKDYRFENLKGASESTVRQFEASIKNFRLFLNRYPTIQDLTDSNISGAMWDLVERGRAIPTANKLRANLVALWRYLREEGCSLPAPKVGKIIEPIRIPTAWSREHVRRLFSCIRALEGEICGIPQNLWFQALHFVLWDTAERIGAVLQLRKSDLDLHAGTILIRAETRKWRTRDMIHDLHSNSIEILKRLLETSQADELFPMDFDVTELYRRYKKILKSAGLPTDRKHMFHCIRRTVASIWESEGHDATRLLDHASRKTTQESYLDPRITGTRGPSIMQFRPDDPVPVGPPV